MSHTLTVPSSLPVTIHLPFAEYARAVTFAVCPSSVATGLAFNDGMSHILRISCITDGVLKPATYRTEAFPAAAKNILSGLMANLFTCFCHQLKQRVKRGDAPSSVEASIVDNRFRSMLPRTAQNDRLS